MKKITQCLVALMLLFGGTLSTFAYDFAAGTGTATDPYQIATKADLVGVGDYFNDAANPTATGKHYLQTADIDLEGDLWKSMGDDNSAKSFRGHFDGGNFKISNMTVDGLSGETTGTVYYFGLFEAIGPGALIENVHIDGGAVIVSTDGGARVGSAYAGGIAGYAAGTNAAGEIIIRNCSNSATITNGALNSNYTGGIVGHASLGAANYTTSLIISYCANTGGINGNLSRGGGIVGSAQSNVNGDITISNCYNNAEISSTRTSGDAFIGGITGTPYLGTATSGPVTINKCFAAGRLDDNLASASRTGGIAGRLYGRAGADDKITIKNSVAAQDEIVTAYSSAGRVWSSTTAGTTYVTTNNYGYKGMILKGATVTGTDPNTKNGLDKTLAELQTAATYAELGWDLANVWEITAGNFPTLRPNATEVEIPTPYTVTFTVKDATATAITDAVVTLNSVANAAGNYVFTDIAAGEYAYSVAKAGYVTATGNVTVSDANVTKDITLELEPVGGPILIATRVDLAAIATDLTAEYKLTADIDLAGEAWTPIAGAFTGKLYGDNYSIKNISVSAATGNLGLFAELGANAYIEKVHIVDGSIAKTSTTAAGRVGAIAGFVSGAGVIITGCSNSASLSNGWGGNSTSNALGGIVGQATHTSGTLSITKCFNTGNLTGGSVVGGILGSATAAGKVTISTCYSNATTVVSTSSTNAAIGGLVGYSNTAAVSVSNSYAAGSLTETGTSNFTGNFAGILGKVSAATSDVVVSNSLALQSTITSKYAGSSNYTARVKGYNAANGTQTNNYASSTMTVTTGSAGNYSKNAGVNTEDGEDVILADAQTAAWYAANLPSWDFENTWEITEGNFPTFKPESSPTPTTYTVTFTVKDESATAITDAVVTFNEVANAAGNYVFTDIAAGEYAYSVAKEGYDTATGSITVTDANVTEPVILTETVAPASSIKYVVPDGTGDGSSWENALGSIKDAYDLVSAPNDEVRVKIGSYPFEAITLKSGVHLKGGYTGVDDTRVSDPSQTVWNGSATATTPFLTNTAGLSASTEVSGLTFTGTKSTTQAVLRVALTGTASIDLKFLNNIFHANESVEGTLIIGGASGNTGRVSFENCVVSKNTATKATLCNGGIYLGSGTAINVSVINSTIVGNSVPNYAGGSGTAGLSLRSGTTNKVSNTLFYGNTTSSGIGNYYKGGSATVALANNVNAATTTNEAIDFVNYANNDYRLAATATNAIDAGSDVAGEFTATDILGNAITGAKRDIGAYEWQEGVTYTVTFTIKDASGTAITDAVVTLNNVANAAGNYVFAGIAAGTYDYSVVKEGYETATGSVTVTNANVEEPVTLQLTPDPTYSVTFEVKDASGTAITDAVVTFNNVANAAGNYVFTEITAGTYDYSVVKEGYITATGSVTVTNANVVEEITLQLVPEPTYSVTFDVKGLNGDAITDAVVTFDNTANAAGNYVFADVLAGEYDYSVVKEGYGTVLGSIIVTDANVTVPVTLSPPDGIGSVDANDAIVETKYYNLQGFEVTPTATGVYIVRNIHASGKVTSSKELKVVR